DGVEDLPCGVHLVGDVLGAREVERDGGAQALRRRVDPAVEARVLALRRGRDLVETAREGVAARGSVRPERAGRRLDAGEPVAEVRGVARLRQRPRPGLLALVEDDLPDAEDAGVE